MPNWTINRVEATKSVIERLVNDSGNVDFNRILPIPKAMETGEIPFSALWAAKAVVGLRNLGKDIGGAATLDGGANDLNTEDLRLVALYLQNYCEYGAMNWYDWCCRNWGTNRNAVQTNRVSESVIHFETAWHWPVGVLIELAKQSGECIRIQLSNEDDYYEKMYRYLIEPDGSITELPVDDKNLPQQLLA